MNDLKNKNIIVTGATGGIGNSIVKKLNDCEANILASGTKSEKLDELISKYSDFSKNITIEKGSITINGVSLTVIDSKNYYFSVAIIPYTYENTNFKNLKEGSIVNLEFDMIGKYINKLHSNLI